MADHDTLQTRQTWPAQIYLVAGDKPLLPFKDITEVTWCSDMIGAADVPYVRDDLHDQKLNDVHRQLAAERLRADQGWDRYKAANADRNTLREERAQLVTRIAELERQLALKLEPLKTADIIMVRADLKPDDMVRIRYALQDLMPQAKQMVLVPGGMELAGLDDAAMRAAGWVRAEANKRTVTKVNFDATGFPVSCEMSDGTICDTADGISWTPRTALVPDQTPPDTGAPP